MSPTIRVREATSKDQDFLWDMLYEAVFTKEGAEKPPRNIIYSDTLKKYAVNWKQANEYCYIAENTATNKAVGALWLRYFKKEEPGYGFIHEDIPELSIAVEEGFRRQGIGNALLTYMLKHLPVHIYSISLSVTKENPAIRLYESVGFKAIETDESNSVIMRLDRNMLDEKVVYLTFDDGPFEDFTQRIDYLDQLGIKAIWFCLGSNLKKYKSQAIDAIKKGHIIANHSYDHYYYKDITLEEAKYQITKTDELIDQLYREAQIPRHYKYFRFPYLNNGDDADYLETQWNHPHVSAIQKHLKELGYTRPNVKDICYNWFERAGFLDCINVDCTFDTFDWGIESPYAILGYDSIEAALARMDEDVPEAGRGLNRRFSNEIVMMHAYVKFEYFESLMEKLIGKNVTFKLPE